MTSNYAILQDAAITQEVHTNDPLQVILMFEVRGTNESRSIGKQTKVYAKLQTYSHAIVLFGDVWLNVLMRMFEGTGTTARLLPQFLKEFVFRSFCIATFIANDGQIG